MRVAYISADLGVPVFGRKGCSIHVQEVVQTLRRRGAQVQLFSTNCDGTPPHGLETLSVHTLPRPPKGERAAREASSIALNREWMAAVEREGPFDFVYERYSLWSHSGMEYARRVGVPGLLEVNSPLIEEQAVYRVLIDRGSAEGVAHKVFGDASVIIAVSDELVRYLERFPGARGKVRVVANGVNPNRYPRNLTPSLPAEEGIFTIGFVGTLKPWHGLSVLIDAFALVLDHAPNARLLIVGDGTEKEKLLGDLSSRNLLEQAHFTGAMAHTDVPGLLASMDVAVAPYPNLADFYFSPLKVYEYMAAGLPVVVSNIGQLGKLINHDVNGLLVPAGDAGELAHALVRLRNEPLLRARLGEAARACILHEHTWEKVVDRIFALADLHLHRKAGSSYTIERS